MQKLKGTFNGLKLIHVLCRYNEAVDKLARLGFTHDLVPSVVFLQELRSPSIKEKVSLGFESYPRELPPPPVGDTRAPGVEVLLINLNWTKPFMDYMLIGTLPQEKDEAWRIVRCAKAYTIINKDLHKRSTFDVLQRCTSQEEGKLVLQEVHLGACGHHITPKSLVGKAFWQGFNWPTMVTDASQLMRTYEGCQYYT